jgi:NADPH2:quinone reductase
MDVIGSGAVTVTVGSSYPLAQAAHAHRDLHERKTIGAAVLLPS